MLCARLKPAASLIKRHFLVALCVTDTLCLPQVEPTLINISPQLIDIGPRGVIAEAAGIAIENRLIDIAPGGRSDAFLP